MVSMELGGGAGKVLRARDSGVRVPETFVRYSVLTVCSSGSDTPFKWAKVCDP